MRRDLSIAYHLGAPHTDNDLVTWSLRKETDVLVQNDIMIRRPKEYRPTIRSALKALQGDVATPEQQEKLLSAIVKNQSVRRLILSDSGWLGMPAWVLTDGVFYQKAGKNTQALRRLFPDHACEFFLSISNPAHFLPEVFKSQSSKGYRAFFKNADLYSIRWTNVISQILEANPDCSITVWCNEDTPIIWPRVLSEITALDPQTDFKGAEDVLRSILTEEGAQRLDKYLEAHPKMSEAQRQRVGEIFFEKFANPNALEDEVDLPDWTEEVINSIGESYEIDIDQISMLPRVKFISAPY